MPGIKPTHADLLALLVSQAKGLREVGVLHVELDGLEFDLAPLHADAPASRGDVDEAEIADEMDPLLDAATYGRADGRVPGFQRPDADDEDN